VLPQHLFIRDSELVLLYLKKKRAAAAVHAWWRLSAHVPSSVGVVFTFLPHRSGTTCTQDKKRSKDAASEVKA